MPISLEKSKKNLKKLIQNSAILPKEDKEVLMDRLDDFSSEKVVRLIDSFTKEQEKIIEFDNEAKQIKSEYRRALENENKKLRTKSKQKEEVLAEELLKKSLTEI